MRLLSLTSIALLMSFNSSAQDTTHHQFDIGFSDLRDFDDRFFGMRYRFYFEDLIKKDDPHKLIPYLNQIDSISVSGFSIDDVDHLAIQGEKFLEDDLIVSGYIKYIQDDTFYGNEKFYETAVTLGKKLTDTLQVGISVFYNYEKEYDSYHSSSNSEFTVGPYVRWTNIEQNQGWDLELKQYSGKEEYIQTQAAYYINKQWSISLSSSIEMDDFDNNNVELQTEYWFGDLASIRFGLGTRLGDDNNDIKSATLLVSTRF
jgi:hypothetical protein